MNTEPFEHLHQWNKHQPHNSHPDQVPKELLERFKLKLGMDLATTNQVLPKTSLSSTDMSPYGLKSRGKKWGAWKCELQRDSTAMDISLTVGTSFDLHRGILLGGKRIPCGRYIVINNHRQQGKLTQQSNNHLLCNLVAVATVNASSCWARIQLLRYLGQDPDLYCPTYLPSEHR